MSSVHNMYEPAPPHHPLQPPMAPRRRADDDDTTEDQLSYLPGSGPAATPEYGFEYPPPPGFVTAFWNPYEVKHRRRTSRAQLGVLETEFEKDPKPNADKRRSLAAQLSMTPRAIQVWFQNRRAKIKAIKNKIPGGRGMPKLKPAERAAARAGRAGTSDPPSPIDDQEESNDWVQLSPEESPMSSPGEPAFPAEKPQFMISVPPNDATLSGPSSPSFPPPAPVHVTEMLAPPSAAAMLRRGSAPAPLQGIHRARYSVFNHPRQNTEPELAASPISPLDHQIAPLRRPCGGLARRPSLPDSHLRLPAHPYYPHANAPRTLQRRGGLLSPVPDVSQEQEQAQSQSQSQAQYPPLPTMLPPAPAVGSSRMYRALSLGIAAHDLPARPSTTWTPQRPFAAPLSGPLPAADFSFGAPELGHGDAFTRVMSMDAQDDFHQEYTNEYPPPQLWDARTRFGSIASIASDVTGVSVSSTQATSVSGAPTFNSTAEFECPQPSYGYPNGFQPDLRRASCPGEFLHQFSGMGVAASSDIPVRPSPLGRSLAMAPDSMVNQDKSLRSPTFPPGHVDPTYPPPQPEQGEQAQIMSPMMSPSNQGPNPSLMSQQHLAQTTLSPTQRSLVGGGFGNGYEQGYANEQNGYVNGQENYAPDAQTNGYPDAYVPESQNGYTSDPQSNGYTSDAHSYTHSNEQVAYPTDPSQPYAHTPPSFETSPMGGVPVLGLATNMEIFSLNKEPRMLFADGYQMMVNQEYTHPAEFSAYS